MTSGLSMLGNSLLQPLIESHNSRDTHHADESSQAQEFNLAVLSSLLHFPKPAANVPISPAQASLPFSLPEALEYPLNGFDLSTWAMNANDMGGIYNMFNEDTQSAGFQTHTISPNPLPSNLLQGIVPATHDVTMIGLIPEGSRDLMSNCYQGAGVHSENDEVEGDCISDLAEDDFTSENDEAISHEPEPAALPVTSNSSEETNKLQGPLRDNASVHPNGPTIHSTSTAMYRNGLPYVNDSVQAVGASNNLTGAQMKFC